MGGAGGICKGRAHHTRAGPGFAPWRQASTPGAEALFCTVPAPRQGGPSRRKPGRQPSCAVGRWPRRGRACSLGHAPKEKTTWDGDRETFSRQQVHHPSFADENQWLCVTVLRADTPADHSCSESLIHRTYLLAANKIEVRKRKQSLTHIWELEGPLAGCCCVPNSLGLIRLTAPGKAHTTSQARGD